MALPAPVKKLATEMASQKVALQSALPDGMPVERFMRTALNGIQTHRDSGKLLKADRQSLFNALQRAAADGLLLDGREATLVTFGNEAAYMPMVQGLVQLARNSGEITTIDAEVVYEQDDFTYRPGKDREPDFNPDWKIAPSQRGDACLAFAVVALKSGEKIVSVLHKERIMKIGSGGKNAKQYDPKNGAHWSEWWRKTVIRHALKYAPKSTYLQSALDHDNIAEGFDFDEPQPEVPSGPATTEDINADLATEPAGKADPEPKQSDERNPPDITDAEVIEPSDPI